MEVLRAGERGNGIFPFSLSPFSDDWFLSLLAFLLVCALHA
jgi:hypothetical protein